MEFKYPLEQKFTKQNYKTTVAEITNGESTQNLLCRAKRAFDIVASLGFNPFQETNSGRLRPCSNSPETCRGAHCQGDVKPFPHIVKFDALNKATYTWPKLFAALKKIIAENTPAIKNADFLARATQLPEDGFFETIQLWRELACFHRKLAKELPMKEHGSATTHASGYKYSNDVPTFKLSEAMEDTAWAFEKHTRRCYIQAAFEDKLQRKAPITPWDICLGDVNCKEGIHTRNEKICQADFMTGACSCLTTAQLEAEELVKQQQVIELSTHLLQFHEETTAPQKVQDEWATVRKGKPKAIDIRKKQMLQDIAQIQKEIADLQIFRMIHYSEQGMIPFVEQYRVFLAAEEAKAALQAQKAPIVEEKASWDHGLDTQAEITKPVIKLTKLGKKK